MENVLITGGAGFIGLNIAEELVKSGKNVWVLDNFVTGSRAELSRAVPHSHIDQVDIQKINADKYKDIDTIFHFASPCSMVQFIKEPLSCTSETISNFITVMELARQNCAMVVFPSSSTVYGNSNGAAQKESDPLVPINLYGVSKLNTEIIADYYRNNYGVIAAGLRIFAGYGTGERKKESLASAVTMFLNEMIKGKEPVVWGDGKQERDFVFIDDVVDMAIKCANKRFNSVVNVGSGESTSFNDLIEMLNSELGTKITPKYVEKPTIYLERTKADLSFSKEEFGFRPTELKSGIKKYVEHFKKEHGTKAT